MKNGKNTHYSVISIDQLKALLKEARKQSKEDYNGKVVGHSTITLLGKEASKEHEISGHKQIGFFTVGHPIENQLKEWSA